MEERQCESCKKLEQRIAEQDQRLAEMQAQIDKLTKMLFGQKSEKSKKEKEVKQQPSNDSSSEPKGKDIYVEYLIALT